MYTPDNGVPAGSVLSFTMLAGIVLSDVETGDAGNLVVWPGSHLVENYSQVLTGGTVTGSRASVSNMLFNSLVIIATLRTV